MSGTHQDVSVRKENEARLVEARKKADAANKAKSQFMATMSHEIRTPMNGILGMAQMLLAPGLQDSLRDDYARTVLSSGKMLLTLLNDVLDLSKIEAGKLQLESAAVAPQALIRETGNLFAGAALTKGLQLDCQFHGEPEQRYRADANRLRQMLANLVGNALKFTHAGQVRIDAQELKRSDDASVLEFSVSDTGIGIPADKLGLLFKPFSQTDSSTTREYGGSGLGLSIVSHLAKAMGGEVGVRSEAGRGSRFWFQIPAVRVTEVLDSHRVESPSTPASDTGVATRLSGHVLVAEDNLVNCMVIESLLRQLGLTVTLVHDGQQAVDALVQAARALRAGQDKLPDLILMDLHMPVMDGYSATETIRRWEAESQRTQLPIIALTADAYEEDRQHCLTVGMDDFLTKPIALDALKLSLGKWLQSVRDEEPADVPLMAVQAG